MDLMSNVTFRILKELNPTTEYSPGIYRVILDEPQINKTICVLIAREEDGEFIPNAGRIKKAADQLKRPQKKRRPALVGKLLWMNRTELRQLATDKLLMPITIGHTLLAAHNDKRHLQHNRNVAVMSSFLNLQRLRHGILIHAGLGRLVKETTLTHNVSRGYVYEQWSNLCKLGLHENSLIPRLDGCGAPGTKRPCNPPAAGRPARQKAGRKTLFQRIALAYGEKRASEQPGMTLEWAAAIRAADKQIPLPKLSWPTRCKEILRSAFCGRVKEENGAIVRVISDKGTYPTNEQIKRVLTVDKSRLERIIERTSHQFFKSSLRGLVARNWQGVAGPGHTWAIDSTVGDIYLRSSVNRAWIVGRPIVYVIVDIWSTAVVGFYVCLTGPSWNTAKISLFNSVADPALVAQMWGYKPILSLNPAPTMCYGLMCDRGEYLSSGHRKTALNLLPMTSYAPPYRGDLKGLAEVLHRIEKDAQFLFIPGAMDFRRLELELRRVNPNDCVFTVREYTQYLYELFSDYNLTANRRHRMDAHMIADGVFPSPAGLWKWGHAMGIGFRQYQPESLLVTELLPSNIGRVRRDAVRYAGNDYSSKEVKEEQWTAIARNLGGWDIPLNYYPGSVSSIWTPDTNHSNLLHLRISDESRASAELTFDEWSDTLALATMRRADEQHQRMMNSLEALDRIKALRASAEIETVAAIAKTSGTAPTMTEARVMELAATTHPSRSEEKVREEAREDAAHIHNDMITKLLASANFPEEDCDAA